MSRAESVHPRLRGELLNGAPLSQDQGGSSPLTRGTQKTAAEGCRNKRFIPAYAGNSCPAQWQIRDHAVHPRLRGELFCLSEAIMLKKRFIPAYAGNSLIHNQVDNAHAVHPRLRGELVRIVEKISKEFRFIPAYAGNSKDFNPKLMAWTVHPRLRGELMNTSAQRH